MSKKSVQEVSKNEAKGFAKTNSRYWQTRLYRNTYTIEGERRETEAWCIKIKHAGKRETLNLRTSNQAVAAKQAANIYKTLISKGWGTVLAEWKPKAVIEVTPATVGEFITAVAKVSPARDITVAEYGKCLRRIVADVAGLSREDASRFDYRTGGTERWKQQVDKLPLSILTPPKVQAWRLSRVRDADNNPALQRSAKTTANSTIRKAKSLFSPKVLRHIEATLELPPNPFAGVEFFERSTMRYESKVDASKLIAAAAEELGGNKERMEQWKAFVLLMFAGLRKNEADKLRWEAVDFAAGLLRIEDHEFFQAKCEASKGSVELDAEVMTMLKGWRAQDPKGEFVLRSNLKPQQSSTHFHYRASRTFDALQAWLKSKGITARKALHELRKEAGSLVAQLHGIFAASRFLRHADINITSAHYLDKKERVTVGLGSLLTAAGAAGVVVPFVQPDVAKIKKPKQRRNKA